MAHMVESMMYAGAVPWHGLGTPVKDTHNIALCMRDAGLDWQVQQERLYTSSLEPVDSHFALVRDVRGKRDVLDVVGKDWTPLQNIDAFRWFQPWLDTGAVTLHTAGSLDKGRRVWVLAKTSDTEEVRKGDAVESYILLSNAHRQGVAVSVGFTPIRVVCANTLRLAVTDKASRLIKVRHNDGMHVNLAAIRETMSLATAQFSATMAQYRELAARGIDQRDVKRYVRTVLEMPDDQADTPTLARILAYAQSGRGNGGNTLWDAYNGVTEYLSYESRYTTDARINSLWFGSGAAVNQHAFDVAILMAT